VIIKSSIPRLTKAHKLAVSRAVRATALSIEADAKRNIIANGLVDTGFMLNSVQTRVIDDSNAEVGVGAEYAVFHELGSSKLPARPFLTPAVDGARRFFEKSIKEALAA
jgi:HK97 gp10 family phage protein